MGNQGSGGGRTRVHCLVCRQSMYLPIYLPINLPICLANYPIDAAAFDCNCSGSALSTGQPFYFNPPGTPDDLIYDPTALWSQSHFR